jgi:hypothetical protein
VLNYRLYGSQNYTQTIGSVPCQFTQILNLHSVFCLTPIDWLRSVTPILYFRRNMFNYAYYSGSTRAYDDSWVLLYIFMSYSHIILSLSCAKYSRTYSSESLSVGLI